MIEIKDEFISSDLNHESDRFQQKNIEEKLQLRISDSLQLEIMNTDHLEAYFDFSKHKKKKMMAIDGPCWTVDCRG